MKRLLSLMILLVIFLNLLTLNTIEKEGDSPMTESVAPEEIFVEVPQQPHYRHAGVGGMRWKKASTTTYSYMDKYESFYNSIEKVMTYLRDNSYVEEGVDDEELHYIVGRVMTIANNFDFIPSSLGLSLIANESGFDKYCQSNAGARGLCQVIPKYHANRLSTYLEDGEEYDPDMFFNVTLNIQTGLDYLSQILVETEGDVTYALMWYNQGPSSAYDSYISNGKTSSYAEKVIALATELEDVLCNDQ